MSSTLGFEINFCKFRYFQPIRYTLLGQILLEISEGRECRPDPRTGPSLWAQPEF